MAKSVLVPDSLTHAGGVITAVLGSKTYTVGISGLAQNTRYQLYIIPGGTLVYSTNEHSVGPVGQNSWCLIGSFYSNGITSPAFGSFIRDLFSSPETEYYSWTSVAAGLGSGSGTFVYNQLKRKGQDVIIKLRFDKDGTSGTGTALVTFTQPPNTPLGSIGTPIVGVGESSISTFGWNMAMNGSDPLYFYNGGSFLLGNMFSSGRNLIGNIDYPVLGWSTTPIAYL